MQEHDQLIKDAIDVIGGLTWLKENGHACDEELLADIRELTEMCDEVLREMRAIQKTKRELGKPEHLD